MNKQIDIKSFAGMTQDSRAVKKGYLFAAIPGSKADGRDFIAAAVRNGARAVLAPTGTQWPHGVPEVALVTDDNPRRALAKMAAQFYELQPARIVAVTGTNGKTSTVHFVKQLWLQKEIKAASIGTLGILGPGLKRSGAMTTPDPVTLHAELADLAAAGFTHLAMEASSHGLDQFRLDGVKITAAGFTNFTRDHLDYHATMEVYFNSKKRLLSEVLSENGTAVLNADMDEYAALEGISKKRGARVISYGKNAKELKIISASSAPHGHILKLEVFGKAYQVELPVVGDFQIMNALCALGLVLSEFGNDRSNDDFFVNALAKLHGPPGRLQLVPGHPNDAAVYVDYAHTPDALQTVLKALRHHTQGKLVCIFGCGGDRDRGKRAVMGKIASELADNVIVTDDNPRSENPESIRKEIMQGCPAAQEIMDRRQAIREGVAMLGKGDVLIIAGKGHEQGQIFADHTESFDDATEAENAMREIIKK